MRAGAKGSRGGFTLIELLLVISIILLLLTILVVAVHNNSTGVVVAMQRMNTLSAALDAYKNVFGVYPPSNQKWDHNAPQYGAQCLYYYLKGKPDSNGVSHGWSNALHNIPVEFNWEGAMNVGADWTSTPNNPNLGTAQYFNDGIPGGDRAMLYYRASWMVGQAQNTNGAPTPPPTLLATSTLSIGGSLGLYSYYRYEDNCDAGSSYTSDSPFWPGQGNAPPKLDPTTGSSVTFTKQQQWENEITDIDKTRNSSTNANDLGAGDITMTTPAAQRYPQRAMTYILISAGVDREFGLPSDPSKGWASDDIMNFTP